MALPVPDADAYSTGDVEEPLAEIENTLAAIWAEVLNLEHVGRNDDFFDLGGHSLLIARLLSIVESRLGVRVPVASLFQHPTLREFSDLLAEKVNATAPRRRFMDGGASRRESRFVAPLLWAGGDQSLRDLTANLWPVSEVLPIWMQNEQWESLDRSFLMEGLGRTLANIIKERYPEEPYMVGGFCAGAVLAYETARQLSVMGADVALLVMVDALYPKSRDNPSLADRMFKRMQKEIYHARQLRGTPLKQWGSYLGPRLHNILDPERDKRWLRGAELTSDSLGNDYSRFLHIAAAQYEPKPYGGRLAYFQSKDRRGSFWDPAKDWRPLVGNGGEFHDAPGDHSAILKSPNVEVIAERLRQLMLEVPHARDGNQLDVA
jgi:thioesterase domain-containing protein/acyl carrier protein